MNPDKTLYWMVYKRPLPGGMRMLEVGVCFSTEDDHNAKAFKKAAVLGEALVFVKDADEAVLKVPTLHVEGAGVKVQVSTPTSGGGSTTGKPCPKCGKDMTHRDGESVSETDFVKDDKGNMVPKTKKWAGWFCPDSKKDGTGVCKQKPMFTGAK